MGQQVLPVLPGPSDRDTPKDWVRQSWMGLSEKWGKSKAVAEKEFREVVTWGKDGQER